jgi:hypothetical protein
MSDRRPKRDKNRLRKPGLRSGKSASLNVADARAFPFGSDFRRVACRYSADPCRVIIPKRTLFEIGRSASDNPTSEELTTYLYGSRVFRQLAPGARDRFATRKISKR